MCLGLPLGVKMGRLGLKLMGMEEPAKRDSLVVFVENDKCPVDGIQVTTGCTAGSGRLKMLDYGKSAATFVDGRTGSGFRVSTKQDFQQQALRLGIRDGIVKPGEKLVPNSKLDRQVTMNAFMKMTQDELLEYKAVRIKWDKPLMPNRSLPRTRCDECGDEIMDGKGVSRGTKVLCGTCAGGVYYSKA
jgi:formylmethanofuran dehydrogenase subunit E